MAQVPNLLYESATATQYDSGECCNREAFSQQQSATKLRISKGFASFAGEREWRLCHSSHTVAAGKFGNPPAAIGCRLAEMAAVSRVGAEQVEMKVV